MANEKILVVDDEEHIAELISYNLSSNGYKVITANNGIDAVKVAIEEKPSLILLDLMIPGKDGYDVCKEIRGNKEIRNIPIIMLTAKSDEDDKVSGLRLGADDYLTKPFMTKELLARLRALGRRTLGTTDGILSFGDITLDTSTLILSCTTNGQSVRLSEKEYRILAYLIANRSQILTREQLAVKIWGFESDAQYNNVEVYMSFTRKKLSFVEAKTEIKAVRGIGYELRCDDV